MVAKAHMRGHRVFFVDEEWRYCNGTIANEDTLCFKCKNPPTQGGYDDCLGYIPGAISACCGHGVEEPYIVLQEDKMKNTGVFGFTLGPRNDDFTKQQRDVDFYDNYNAALRKRNQLEKEIAKYTDGVQRANLLHSLSKMWMYLMNTID